MSGSSDVPSTPQEADLYSVVESVAADSDDSDVAAHLPWSEADQEVLEQAVASQDASSLSRRHFLFLGAAACGSAALLKVNPAQADILDTLNKFLYLDDIVLNYVHEMEELQYEFFTRVSGARGYEDLEARERNIFGFIANQDKEHFQALERVRDRQGAKGGGHFEMPNASSSRQPRIFNFPTSTLRSREALLSEAIALKEDVVFAYHGAVDLLRDKKLLTPAAAIAGVDGRHLAVLREMAGRPPVPTPFEGQVSPQKIGNRLTRYGFSGGAMRVGGKIP